MCAGPVGPSIGLMAPGDRLKMNVVFDAEFRLDRDAVRRQFAVTLPAPALRRYGGKFDLAAMADRRTESRSHRQAHWLRRAQPG
jgi:hypothetical protein